MSEVVMVEKQAGITTVTLNRPKQLNALNDQMARDLKSAMQNAVDADTRLVIIQGAGNHFMAGGDVGFFHQGLSFTREEREKLLDELISMVHDSVRLIRDLSVPVLGLVHGNVAGFGMSLMSACDLVIADENCLFTQAYTNIGVTPDGGNTYFIPRLIGAKKFMAMTLLNQSLNASDALAAGLISQVVPSGELAATGLKVARKLAKGPTKTYANVKRLVNQTFNCTLQQQLDAEQESFTACALSNDFAEGVTAFVEKRKPEFGQD